MTNNRHGFEQEYPFPSHFFDFGGTRCHYIDEGRGEALLCVHGNPTWSFAWRNLVKNLSANNRVIAIDHVGCGYSDKPQNYPYQLEKHIDNLVRFIEGMNLRQITLIAHDWGGAIGMGAAGRLPDRFDRFVMMNTAAFRSSHMPWRIAVCRWPVIGPWLIRGLNAFPRGALRMAVEHRERMTAAVQAGYLAPYSSWSDRVAVLRFIEDIPLAPSHPSYGALLRVEEQLERFRESPALLIWGAKDWCFTPAFLAEFQRRWPRAETLSLDDAGHYVFEDAHERIVPRIRDFLAAHPLPTATNAAGPPIITAPGTQPP